MFHIVNVITQDALTYQALGECRTTVGMETDRDDVIAKARCRRRYRMSSQQSQRRHYMKASRVAPAQ